MAKQITTLLIDDIDRSEATETINFSLDGVNYEIDLNANHAYELRNDMRRWTDAARKVPSRRRRGGATPVNPATRELNRTVRAWAQSKGIQVSDRGRVPINLIEQYRRETGNYAN